METRVGEIAVHYVEHGAGRPVLVLHGAGVDHREAEACLEPVFGGVAGFRRIYPDLPGMGRTVVSDGLRSAENVLDTLLDFAGEVTDGTAHLLIGHSAGAYYAQAMAAREPRRVAGLALVCPLLVRGRVLVVNGPFDEQSDPSYRGMSIFACAPAEAARLSDGDPSVMAGRLAYDVMEWWVGAGSFSFPLTDRPVGERRSMPDH